MYDRLKTIKLKMPIWTHWNDPELSIAMMQLLIIKGVDISFWILFLRVHVSQSGAIVWEREMSMK